MKKQKISKKRNIALTFSIILIVAAGISFAFCVICGIDRRWIEFAVYLAVTIVLGVVIIPLSYVGESYECPKCGHKFKVNPYKVFFTHGIFYIGPYAPKRTKLKCPNCKTKDWCKNRYE